ncbi:inter-alpha-trypsin inhibitor domain-containing protein [Mycobacterium sp. 20KCMC460]|uniref:Inter-alpha-trypsin inhibitor domain-containing protein n=1 Tax=Mycobacterium kiyosense TaxID=2871094 RepID=A0A9P3Q197_9MYCO|nr:MULTISPECIES: VIT domain-containing protein [Mycobacterium]BDE12590.1 inter-alpha-trypsin inhibitor domain-containing protein [Mycobacterium sp. 20KCMC460]GLB84908.1 inter-alpha-trypsin inhibitor domain-containing protein [Mycobacterium kiyosense]GLB98065.1 inter-alpha-trypsin inhibitor domain-containing protein [Mycobacterium kiyosense]GLC10340.1 inter-alpha-trypsin inhibitor domain-containing protein [Mycobacterium kiyosense]GLD29061.1 inter-alpha-trypsin inhibitor domain-containing prote
MSAQLLPLLSIDPQPVRTGRPSCGELSAADGRPLPLKALRVQTAIVGMTATSTVRQRFVNDGDTTIEATYVFPLPARAGVTDFVADLAGRRVVGLLKERGQARADYEQAIVAGQRAAIVEEDRSDVFSVRVGNIGPGEEAAVEMRLTGPLSFEDGEATFRYPLVVAPRYTTGRALPGDQTGAGDAADTDAVPDASRVTPPRLLDSEDRPDLDIALSVDGAGLTVSDLRASLPTVVTEGDGPTVLRVEPGARADRDFVLRFRVDRSALSSSALLVPDPDGAEGTWSVTVLPPAQTSSAPRDVVVVLDRSGSMHGWKMIAARRAAGRIVDMLDAGDRFCVMAFDDRIDTPAQLSLVEADDRNRFAAASWLGSLESRGGTEMAEPLQRAVQLLGGSGGDRQASVVLVTDGQITGEDQLLRTLAPAVGRTRIYCVGIDRAVNAGFLDRLAQLGTGRSELVESEERLDEAMARLARTIGRPALTGLRVSAEGIQLVDDTVTPSRAPDAFAGVPCVISGRYRAPAGHGAATFRVDADGAPVATLEARVAPEAVAVQTIWARSVVRDLEDDYAAYRADDELAARIVAHSIRFGVLSRFTAFVAIDPEHTDAGPLTEVIQPVEEPSGWAANVGFAPAGRAYAMDAALMAAPPMDAAPMAAPAMCSAPPPSPLRPLDKLLKRVEKATQVRRSGLDVVLAELEQHRDATIDPDLRAALVQLCNALARFLKGQTQAQSREVLVALDAVRRLLGTGDRGRRGSKLRFWE